MYSSAVRTSGGEDVHKQFVATSITFWDFLFFKTPCRPGERVTHPGESASPRSPRAELGVDAPSFAGDTEGWCGGQRGAAMRPRVV